MLAIICMLLPAALLVLVRNRLNNKKLDLYHFIVQFAAAVVILNCVMIVVLRFVFSNRGDLILKLNQSRRFSCEYFAISIFLASLFIILEKGINRLIRKSHVNFPWFREGSRMHTLYELISGNTFFRIAVIVEIAALLYICWLNSDSLYERSFSAGEMEISCDDMVLTEEGYRIGSISDDESSSTVLSTSMFPLPPGAFEITVDYMVETEGDASFSVSEGSLILESKHHSNSYYWPELELRDSLSSVSQRVYFNSLTVSGDFTLQIDYYGTSPLIIYQISIQEILGFRFIRFLLFLTVFAAFDACFIFFYASSSNRKFEVAGLIGVNAAASLPLVSDFLLWGHDLCFHLNRILNLSEEIQFGNWWPVIYSTASNGYGFATPQFYGQLFLYIPSCLYAAGMSLTMSYQVFLFLVNMATCLICYYCLKKSTDDSKLALIGSALYTLCAYRLTNLYVRAAVGEYLAMCFLPLVVYGFFRIYTAPKGQKLSLSVYLPVVIGLTGIAQSHIVSAEMIVVLIFIFCVIALKRTLEWNRFTALVKAALLTVLTNLFVIVPFISGMMMDIKGKGIRYYIQSSGAYLMQIFGIFYPGYQQNGVEMGLQGEMPISLGFSLTIGLCLFLICYLWRKEYRKDRRYLLAGGTFLLSMLCIFMASTLFPWDSLDLINYDLADLLTKIQYPWRYLSLASVFAVFCTVASLSLIREKSLTGFRCASVVLIAVLTVNVGLFMVQQLDTSYELRADSNYTTYNMDRMGDHYMLNGTDTSLLYYRNLICDSDDMEVIDYQYEAGVTTIECVNSGSDTAVLEIPLQNYDNYHAYDTVTGIEYDITNGSNNRVAVSIPGNYSGTIVVRYERPLLWKISYCISGITVVAIGIGIVNERRKKHAEVSEIAKAGINCC